jgi:SAM-dependent methyltransferase
MADHDHVKEFFNRKAGSWTRKYALSGPLTHRLELFEERLRQSVLPPARVMELGCGTGNLAARLSELGYDVTGCDIAEAMLMAARQSFPASRARWQLLSAGSTRLPFETATFDAVIASSVLEYIENPEQSLGECLRVLNPSGVLIFSVPNPDHPVRRLELVLRPAAVYLHAAPLPWPRRVQSILKYITFSKNRFPLAYWEALAFRLGLECLPAPAGAAGAMVLLAFRRRRSAPADLSEAGQ